jgi:DNA-binding GntR family transcriptional regulator
MRIDQPGLPVASQRVADILAERILDGTLVPGTRIKQDELAEELNTSRIPVRDALRMLETRGLVTLRANAGARVASMTLKDIEISYEIRERIEPLLLSDSIPNLTEADVDEMRRIATEIEDTTDVERFLQLYRRFHWTSYRGHRAPQLAQIVERLWDTTQPYRREYVKLALSYGARIVAAEHRLLIEAVERYDAETATAVLVMHIRRTRVGLRQYSDIGKSDKS